MTIVVPTLRTWALVVAVLAALAWAAVVYLHDFLAPNHPTPGAKVLVVEAGPSPGVVRYVKSILERGQYTRVIPVGTPIDQLSPLVSFGTDADLWAARLTAVGIDARRIEVVRAPGLPRYRTAHKALAVRRHLDARPAAAVDLVSATTHARRSSLIYARALAPIEVGILSAPQPYDPKEWWNSSAGVRAVIGELLALTYFYVGRDEVARARTEWSRLPAEAKVVAGPSAPPLSR